MWKLQHFIFSPSFKQIAHVLVHVCQRVTPWCTITPCTRLAELSWFSVKLSQRLTVFHRLSRHLQNDPLNDQKLADVHVCPYSIDIYGVECLWCSLNYLWTGNHNHEILKSVYTTCNTFLHTCISYNVCISFFCAQWYCTVLTFPSRLFHKIWMLRDTQEHSARQ